MGGINEADRRQYDDRRVRAPAGFADRGHLRRRCSTTSWRVTRAQAAGAPEPDALVLPEANLVGRDGRPRSWRRRSSAPPPRRVRDLRRAATPSPTWSPTWSGPSLDCFLSQFIFKNPGAWGQPWHQDSYYFPFDPARPIVGVWLAVTEATLENGCLHVLPGSHREPVHEHVPDRRPNANYGYVEIVDHDMAGVGPRAHGPRRPAAVRQPPDAPLHRQRERRRARRRWCTTTAPPARSSARRAW